MKWYAYAFGLGVALSSTVSFAADSAATQQAKTIFRRLTGTGLLASDPRLAQMVKAIESGKPEDAARIATTDKSFYNVTLRNWAAPWSSKDAMPDNTFDDMQATAIGIVRDELDGRLLLTGKLHYEGKASADLPLSVATSADNDHYKAIEDSGQDLSKVLVKVDAAIDALPEAAGVLTSRAFSAAYYSAGTNRRAVVFAIEKFLCTPQTSWRDPNLPETYIRRDVHRDPPSQYEGECRTCHAGMDGMSGAFAHFDFDSKIVYYGPYNVAPKYNIHTDVYPEGYAPEDDSWENYATRHQNAAFGWRSQTSGKGILQFAEMLSQSRAFSTCMTKRAFEATCRRPVQVSDQVFIETVADGFEAGGYNLRRLFEKVAISDECK